MRDKKERTTDLDLPVHPIANARDVYGKQPNSKHHQAFLIGQCWWDIRLSKCFSMPLQVIEGLVMHVWNKSEKHIPGMGPFIKPSNMQAALTLFLQLTDVRWITRAQFRVARQPAGVSEAGGVITCAMLSLLGRSTIQPLSIFGPWNHLPQLMPWQWILSQLLNAYHSPTHTPIFNTEFLS